MCFFSFILCSKSSLLLCVRATLCVLVDFIVSLFVGQGIFCLLMICQQSHEQFSGHLHSYFFGFENSSGKINRASDPRMRVLAIHRISHHVFSCFCAHEPPCSSCWQWIPHESRAPSTLVRMDLSLSVFDGIQIPLWEVIP